ncbi:MAG: methyltransferase domain-containing protein [Planctomycetes bacterium]|nr:methyltransferase domain-containing protein [Planctomycetota bacterium]
MIACRAPHNQHVLMDLKDLARLHNQFAESRALHVAVALGIFDRLEHEPRSAHELATAVGSDPRATEILLDALTALALLRKRDGLYDLHEGARLYLLSRSPWSYVDAIRFGASSFRAWSDLEDVVRRGRPEHTANMFQDDPRATERFLRAMHSIVTSRGDVACLLDAFDWTSVRRVLDVGSGPATFPIGLARAHAHLELTAFDLPGSTQVARTFVREAELEDRIRLVEGDFHRDELPAPFDVILLSNVVHSETEATNAALFENVARALAPGGTCIVKDHVLEEDRTAPPAAALFSLTMLLFTEGRDYTEGEVRAWLESAGLVDVHRLPFGHPPHSCLVLGRKPS